MDRLANLRYSRMALPQSFCLTSFAESPMLSFNFTRLEDGEQE